MTAWMYLNVNTYVTILWIWVLQVWEHCCNAKCICNADIYWRDPPDKRQMHQWSNTSPKNDNFHINYLPLFFSHFVNFPAVGQKGFSNSNFKRNLTHESLPYLPQACSPSFFLYHQKGSLFSHILWIFGHHLALNTELLWRSETTIAWQ